jgi:thiamine-phosphate pyrophosphorylase
MKEFGPLCFITAPSGSGLSPDYTVITLLEAGVRWVQYREKNKSKREMYYEALKLRELTRRFHACFVVNDYADLALAVDADGVHLGQDDLPYEEARHLMGNRIIGISTHSLAEAFEAERMGADYIGFGPLFPTETKEAGAPKGVDGLREITGSVKLPVIAIGGIKAANAASVFAAGCYGIAVSSGLIQGGPADNAARLLALIAAR